MAWHAVIYMNGGDPPPSMISVIVNIDGDTQPDCLTGAEFVLNTIAGGKTAFIRAKPEAGTETDFNTKEVNHWGYVRFSMVNEPGEWTYTENEPSHLPLTELATV